MVRSFNSVKVAIQEHKNTPKSCIQTLTYQQNLLKAKVKYYKIALKYNITFEMQWCRGIKSQKMEKKNKVPPKLYFSTVFE